MRFSLSLGKRKSLPEVRICTKGRRVMDEERGQSKSEETIFPVLTIKQSDLRNRGFSEDQISSLTDEDMHQIASQLRALYEKKGSLQEDLAFVTKLYLIERTLIRSEDK